MSTKRKGHPNSRPLPAPEDRLAQFAATCGEIVGQVILIELRAGKTPGQAALAGAREMIRHAQSLADLERAFRGQAPQPVDCGGCAPPVLTGGPRFTETR